MSMKRAMSTVACSICLVALPTSATDAHTMAAKSNSTSAATNHTAFMEEFLTMQRRGKMIPITEFLQDHPKLILSKSSVQFALIDQDNRDLELSGSRFPRKSFCQDTTDVETFLEQSFLEAYSDLNLTVTLSYACKCTTTGINWELRCGADYYANRVYYGTNVETAIFSLGGDGLYRLVEVWWGDSEYGDSESPQETYYMVNENGDLTSCEGNGCASCTICDGGEFIAIDCQSQQHAQNYSFTCEDNYNGSFLSQYYFGPISEDPTSSSMGLGSYQSHLEFCSNMTHLETFMDQYFQDIFFASDPSVNVSFGCRCIEDGIDLYLKCMAPYTYLGIDGVTRDSAHFEARNGVYELIKTSWGDSRYGNVENNHEEFFYQSGRLIGCRYVGCLSCRICSDGLTARCEDLAVGDDNCYEPGSFTSVYDFGTILVGVLNSNQDFGDGYFVDRPLVASLATTTNTGTNMALVFSYLACTLLWMWN